jgi:hypothetical protein
MQQSEISNRAFNLHILCIEFPLGRPKNSWEDYIINYMKKLKIKNWTSYIQDRNKWKLYVEKDKTFEE